MANTEEAAREPVAFRHPFFFLRHGETTYNRDRRLQGQIDSPLSSRGLEQADAAADVLAAAPIARIVASPLSRARITAERVAARHGLAVETDPDLMECHLGIHQGEPYPFWIADYWRGAFAPEGGEAFPTFRARVWAALGRISSAQADTLIVAHGGLWYASRTLVRMAPDLPSMPNALPLHIAPRGDIWQVDILEERA